MAAAYLDTMLERLLRRSFVDNEDVANGLFDQTKPLGTFSAKIDLAYLLACVGEHARKDLHLIRKIRNEFAHTTDMIGFTAPAIAARCYELGSSSQKKSESPRQRFINIVFALYGMIENAIQEKAHRDRQKALEPTETFKKFWEAITKKLAYPERNEREI